MVGLGMLMLFIGLVGALLAWRGRVESQRWFLRLCLLSAPSGFLAVLTGWLFNRKAFCCWLAMLLLALTQVASNWSQLRYEIAGFDLFAPEHLLALLISYPLLKLLHELAHGRTDTRQARAP